MHTKILFAIILILNHSLLLGEIQAAAMPSDEHTIEHESPSEHVQEFSLEEHLLHEHESTQAWHDCVLDHFEHADHHQHGMHIHLALALPNDFFVDPVTHLDSLHTPYRFSHQNQIYTPPLPPPTV